MKFIKAEPKFKEAVFSWAGVSFPVTDRQKGKHPMPPTRLLHPLPKSMDLLAEDINPVLAEEGNTHLI